MRFGKDMEAFVTNVVSRLILSMDGEEWRPDR
ncbi:hypothetical protein LMG26411_04402 [Cupriavidus numazuensis]|uniref:Transposase n=1 Tax=Cupriavidus numazuensis TaxID=221992 RepID=A0ABM8TLH2_9BURK|nr:hypothetical protein LMG26411_04402 [Cupriavidus numazuensis]